MTDTKSLWLWVHQKTPTIREGSLSALTKFREEVECPHARLLTGRVPQGEANVDSARHLEQAILTHIRLGHISRAVAAQWLRWTYAALKFLAESTMGLDIHPTRLAVIPCPPISPFSPTHTALCYPALNWERSLIAWLASLHGKELTPAEWTAGMVLSSVLIGGLLEAAKVKDMLQQVANDLPTIGNRPYAEFHQAMGKYGDFHCQRWFLDPVTELLLLRKSAHHAPLTSSRLTKAIQTLLREHGTPVDQLPNGMGKLLAHATARWHQHAARVDIEIIGRNVQSHALHERTWNRLFRQLPEADAPVDAENDPTQPEYEEGFLADLHLLHPWLLALSQALVHPPKTAPASVDVTQAIEAAGFKLSTLPEVHKLYVDWVSALLKGKNSTNDRLAVSTIKGLSDAVIPKLLSRLGNQSPVELTLVDFVELYEGLVEGRTGSERVTLAKGLREFHRYLSTSHGIPTLKSIRDTLGDDAGLEPVDANPISVEEYHKARAYLNQQIRRGGDRDLIQIAKLTMMLAFRTGMRRREAFGLRLKDLPDIWHLDIIIQPHEERRLKSDASRRIIPARFLLPLAERRELQAWLCRRFKGADMTNEAAWVFDVPTPQGGWRRLSAERTADRIIEALFHATGQPTKIHQLRHSFGTWMYLAMRAPDYPEVLPLFDHLRQTQTFLKRGSRLRQLLLNHPGPTSRAYGYVVARLLGHSSPQVSHNCYIHSTEFIHRALAIRTADQLPAGALRGVANLKPVWGNRLLEFGVEHLVSHVRAQHARTELAEVTPSTQGPTDTQGQTLAPMPTLPPSRGRPKKLSPQNWIDLMTVHELLHMHSSTSQTLDEICAQLYIKPETGKHILKQVQSTGEGFGFKERGIRPLAFPEFARKQSEWKLIKPLEQRLQRAFAIDPNAALTGTLVHLQHYNPSKRDVVFKGEKERDNLNKYLLMLQRMELEPKDIQILLRKIGEPDIPKWTRKALGPFVKSSARCIAPPVLAKALSYRDWLGLQIMNGNGEAWPGVTRGVMFLAYVVAASHVIEERQVLDRYLFQPMGSNFVDT